MTPVRVTYYSDVLCVWAYVAQRRLDQLARTFGEDVLIETRYCSVFPDAWGKIADRWKGRGGFTGFGRHVREVAERFPHVEVHERVWQQARPRTSASAHLFLKAIALMERERCGAGDGADALPPYLERLSTRAAWAVRRAFFASCRDISDWQVHREIADGLGLDYSDIERRIRSSEAVAALALDYDLAQKQMVAGSPTFLMNEGRQKLFGNVGYRLIEANVQELLRSTGADEASWC